MSSVDYETLQRAEKYNEDQYEKGLFKDRHVVQLVANWQDDHDLEMDGMCGPNTQASLDAAFAGERPAASPLGGAALAVAAANIGRGEEGGNNSGPFVEMLHGKEYDGDDDNDGAWCAAFVSWCFEKACAEMKKVMPFKRSGVAKVLWRRIGEAGSFVDQPEAGDVVCWDRGKRGSWQGHIGFVVKVEDGILHPIEGNVGRYPSKVRRFMHDLERQPRLEGFARPPKSP